MRLLILRHGETDFNRAKRIQGQMQTELSELGKEQARLLGERLKGERISALYCSALKRAINTAEEIGKHHKHLMIINAPELNERSYGVLEGLTFPEIEHKHPRIWPFVLPEKLDITIKPEGGESDEDISVRAMPFIHSVIRKHPEGTVVVVTHGDVIRIIIGELTHMSAQERHDIPLSNVSICELSVEGGRAKVVSLNDHEHIRHLEHTSNGTR